jgi:hypothetical protein
MIGGAMIVMLLLVLVAVDLAAWRWGYDSRDVGTRRRWER